MEAVAPDGDAMFPGVHTEHDKGCLVNTRGVLQRGWDVYDILGLPEHCDARVESPPCLPEVCDFMCRRGPVLATQRRRDLLREHSYALLLIIRDHFYIASLDIL